MKAKDSVKPILTLPIRHPAAVSSGGAPSRIWAEFTDPGPAGDSLTMLKKYADGILPGCMGLVFFSVGTLVIVLFSTQIAVADKKTYVPLIFGAVFALAGFLVGMLGLKTVLGKAGRPAGRGSEPWTSDNAWNREGALPDNPTGGFLAFVGRVFFLLLVGLFNILWTVKMDWTARAIVTVILVVFDLIALTVLYDSVRKLVQSVRVGTPRLTWHRFPFFTGGRFEAVFQTGRPMRPTGPPQVTLRRIEQRRDTERQAGAPGPGLHAYEAWSAKKVLSAVGAGPVTSFPIAIDVPEEEPGTDLSKDECVYWQLLVSVPVAGPDVETVFLVPIYARPK